MGLAALLLACGCETGRTNKMHAPWQHANDVTTTGHPDTTASAYPGHHQPPVPGSPTAAGDDGDQPLNDSQAHTRHDNEHGEAPAPNRQPANSPERHPAQ
jgi:hypothetical protein